ncbi:MAG: CBS domain-containing protein [Candidatus Micrarchaeia archaeon]
MFPELSSIQLRRKRLNITQNALAQKVDISQSLLTKIERGIVIPNYKIACDIFEVLDEYEYKKEKVLSDIMRKHVITLKSSDTVGKTANIAKKYSISQFPVIEKNNIIGSITTSTLIGINKNVVIKNVMKEPFPTLNQNTPLSIASNILKQYPAIIVINRSSILGIVTPEDLL